MDDLDVYVRTLQLPNALRAGLEYFAAVWEHAEDNKKLAAAKLTAPVLAVGGERAIGQHVAKAAEQFAGDVRMEVIGGAGHWLTDEQPAELARLLTDFFADDDRHR